jgi:protocatechuate 3,4-dioxygenase alpha subunit
MTERLAPTPPQTAGPFVGLLLRGAPLHVIGPVDGRSERIRVEGAVCDGSGAPVRDAMIEMWRATSDGRHGGDSLLANGYDAEVNRAPRPCCFGRSGTDPEGRYSFESARPVPIAAHDGRLQAPHLSVYVFARGLLDRLSTRAYFDDEPANGSDPVLRLLPDDRRPTVVARRQHRPGIATYRFDIVLQGDGETVFFDA